jgi:hypothetical protein
MTKYLVFKNDRASGKSNVPGSPEDVACDIARVVEMEGNSKNSFIALCRGITGGNLCYATKAASVRRRTRSKQDGCLDKRCQAHARKNPSASMMSLTMRTATLFKQSMILKMICKLVLFGNHLILWMI